MSADDKILEALARVEHKLDLIFKTVLPSLHNLTQLGDIGHTCPLCKQKVDHNVDITKGVVTRSCACKTGKIALDMGAFVPPVSPARKKIEDNGGTTDEEDRGNPPSRRR